MDYIENSVLEKDFRKNLIKGIPVIMDNKFEAKSNEFYFISTLAGVVEMILPKSPHILDQISWVDISHSFKRNNFIIRHSSYPIEGFNDDLICNFPDDNGILVFTGVEMGWRIM